MEAMLTGLPNTTVVESRCWLVHSLQCCGSIDVWSKLHSVVESLCLLLSKSTVAVEGLMHGPKSSAVVEVMLARPKSTVVVEALLV